MIERVPSPRLPSSPPSAFILGCVMLGRFTLHGQVVPWNRGEASVNRLSPPRVRYAPPGGRSVTSGRIELVGRPCRENLVTRRQCDPGLLAAGPDMPCRPQPGGIVEGARAHPDHTAPRCAANPGAALRAHETGADPPTVCGSLEWPRLDPAQTKASLGHDDPYREGAAGQALTIGAVAGVNQLRGLGDLVANLAALTAAGLRELHRLLPPL